MRRESASTRASAFAGTYREPAAPHRISAKRAVVKAAFYCVSDERYFLGAVGLINSLRLVGHTEPIYLLDCGLTEGQRELLAGEVELVDAPAGAPPTLLKTIAPLQHPAQTMVLIDTDMIATRSLAELDRRASQGKVVAFENDSDRHVAQWGELLDLGPPRRQPYVSFALVVLGGEVARRDPAPARRSPEPNRLRAHLLASAADDRLPVALRRPGRAQRDPRHACGSRAPRRARAAPRGVAPVSRARGRRPRQPSLRLCATESSRYVVHHWLAKPWLEPTHHGVYSQLLQRLLVGDEIAIRVPRAQIPLRFRGGLLAFAERRRINARERLRYHVREPLSSQGRDGCGTPTPTCTASTRSCCPAASRTATTCAAAPSPGSPR